MLILPGFEILTTIEWKAAPPKGPGVICDYTGKGIVKHHTASANRPLISDKHQALEFAKEMARSIQDSHMRVNKWNDSGQHFFISRDGVICEGRSGSISTAASKKHIIKGAHAADIDHNVNCNDWWGVEHEGTYGATINGVYIDDVMPALQYRASVALDAWLCICSNLDSSCSVGHHQTGCGTQCPGDTITNLLSQFHKDVHERKLKFLETIKLNDELEKNK